MKTRIIGSLFALPFAAVGLWMLYSVSTTLADALEMRSWHPVEAQLLRGGYETRSGDSTTFEAFADYRYEFDGRTYTGDRVSLSPGGDNIGDYQRELGSRLADAHASGASVTVWVDPAAPASSILDRTIRWGLVGFKSLFIVVFGGIGFGLLYAVWRAKASGDPANPAFQASPWLANDDWQSASIRSGSKAAMWAAWIFAALWCAISAPLPFIVYEEVLEKDNYLALVALLFPVVGLGLLAWATSKTLEWRRFGATPVVLDPFPGSIGGHVGGTIETRLPYASGQRFVVTLTSLESRVSGSGKNRSRSESAVWQDEQVATARPGTYGTRLMFRFDVPADLEPADAIRGGDSYNIWRLNVAADLPGTDLDRNFDIPVYPTAERSHGISDTDVADSRRERDARADAAAREAVRISYDGLGKKLVYPMGQHVGGGLSGLLFGAIFAGAGAWLWLEEGARLMGLVFGLVGGLIALGSLYLLFKSLAVERIGDRIRSTRRILGIPVRTQELRSGDFERFEKHTLMRSQVGGRHTIHYTIHGIDREGNKIVLGEGFRNQAGVEAGMRMLEQELGLRQRRADDGAADVSGDELVSSF